MADVIGDIEVQLAANDAGLTAAFEKARRITSSLESEMARLTSEEKKGAIATADYTVKMNELAVAHARVTTAMAANAARTNTLNVALSGGAGGMRNFGQGVLMVSQGVEDLQYGLSAVVNNIPMIAMAFGAGAGLAGAISLGSVAVSQLVKNWGNLQDMLGMGIPVPALEGLEKLEARAKEVDKRITELRAKKRLSLPETGELAGLTAEQARLKAESEGAKEIEKLTGGRPKAEKERGAAFAEAVAESGGKMALESLEEALKAKAGPSGKVGVLGAEVDTPRRVAEELFRNAAGGDEAARRSIRESLGAAHPFAERIRELSPEEKQRQADADRFESEGVKRAQESAKLAEKQARTDAERLGGMNQELEVMEEMAAFDESELATKLSPREEESMKRLTERGSDLNWRMMLLQNPTVRGQSLSIDAYQESRKGQGGISDAVKHLHAIQELDKEIRDNTAKLSELRTPRRKPR